MFLFLSLGILADTTGGQVDIVDPLELTKNFHSILATPVIALRVKASIMLHKGLYFRDEDDITSDNKVQRDIGTVTSGSTVTFEYGTKEDLEVDPSVPSLPFQVQIHYTKLDGTEMVRIISKAKPITDDRALAEKDVDVKVPLSVFVIEQLSQKPNLARNVPN